jgi:hypothetical protein
MGIGRGSGFLVWPVPPSRGGSARVRHLSRGSVAAGRDTRRRSRAVLRADAARDRHRVRMPGSVQAGFVPPGAGGPVPSADMHRIRPSPYPACRRTTRGAGAPTHRPARDGCHGTRHRSGIRSGRDPDLARGVGDDRGSVLDGLDRIASLPPSVAVTGTLSRRKIHTYDPASAESEAAFGHFTRPGPARRPARARPNTGSPSSWISGSSPIGTYGG